MKKVLITGGAGFIGSHLVEACLTQGFEVLVLDNLVGGSLHNLPENCEELKIGKYDLAYDPIPDEFFDGVHKVFHLAALADIVPSVQAPVDYLQANVVATANLLEKIRNNCPDANITYAASSSCYGIPAEFPVAEDAKVAPQYPYALTKLMGEELMLHWEKVYGLKLNSCRLFNVFGPRSRTSGAYGAVFGVFLGQLANGLPLTVVGDGEQTRDFIYVTDVVEALLAVNNSNFSGEIFNIGTGLPQSIKSLAHLLSDNIVHVPKRPGEPDVTHADITKIKTLTGWAPKVLFRDGVANMLLELQSYRNSPAWTPEKIAVATEDWFKFLQR